MDFLEIQRENRRKIILLLFLFFLIAITTGAGLDLLTHSAGFPLFTISAFLLSAGLTLAGYIFGDRILLKILGAEEISRFPTLPFKRVANVVAEISVSAGIPVPAIYVINEDFPNAMVLSLSPGSSYLCVTTGLVHSMTREEIQGVIAHEFGHIRAGDSFLFILVSMTWGAFLLLSDWFRTIPVRSGGKSKKIGGKAYFPLLLLAFLFFLLAPVLSKVIAMAISRWKEYQADAASAELTRNPISLARALTKIMKFPAHRGGRKYYATSHMFIADPLRRDLSEGEGFFSNLFNTHPPLKRRVEILAKMAHVSSEELTKKVPEREPLLCSWCDSEMAEVLIATPSGISVKVDQCMKCGGIWFDAWELYAIPPSSDYSYLRRPDFELLWKSFPPKENPLNCPRCGIPLREIKDKNLPPEVTLRRCGFCGGIWLNYIEFKIYQIWREERKTSALSEEELRALLAREFSISPSKVLVHEKDFLDLVGSVFSLLSRKIDRRIF